MNTKIALVSLAVLSTVSLSAAHTVYGLTTRDQLIRFDSSSPNTVAQANFVWGLAANESLVGIDFRPSNNMLYGVGSFGNIYTLNTTNAMATKVATIMDSVTMMPINLWGAEFGVDFNPVPDRLRITSNLGQNLRVNVATGSTVQDGMLNQGSGMPHVVGSAYTNNTSPGTTTQLFNLDSASNMLTLQNPPNAGTQVNVGPLGMDITALAGFDIVTRNSMNEAFAAIQLNGMTGSKFARINLGTGAATLVGDISMTMSSDSLAVRDIAINPVPEPATMLALGAGLAAIARRRRKN